VREKAGSVRRESDAIESGMDSQCEQRLLQPGAADYNVPEGVAQGLHFYMEEADSNGQLSGAVGLLQLGGKG
jgi:hypothetical protein